MVRPENEDSWTVHEFSDGTTLAIVADGMGGAEGGEIASSLAVKYCIEYAVANLTLESSEDLLRGAISHANAKVFEAASSSVGAQGMGTTLTAALFAQGEGMVYVGHVGDSRAYAISRQGIHLVTEDQSITGELIRNGSITEEDAMKHPARNILTAALGTQESVVVSIYTVDLGTGDVMVLCTDGLTSLLSSREVLAILQRSPKDKAAVDLIDAANERGGYDNVTAVILWPEVTAKVGAEKRW